MKIVQNFKEIPSLKKKAAFSIGCFDGVHAGHQKLFSMMRQKVGHDGTCCVLTFLNHPVEYFQPNTKFLKLTTIEYKLFLLEQYGIDLVILLEFNEKIANQEYDQFLDEIRAYLPFGFFLIGEKDSFGKDRRGRFEAIAEYGRKNHFETMQVSKVLFNNKPISSGRIRSLVKSGKLEQVRELLSRPFGIFLTKENTHKRSKHNYQTQLPKDLCLPPNGSYEAVFQKEKTKAILKKDTLSFSLNKKFENSAIYLIKKAS